MEPKHIIIGWLILLLRATIVLAARGTFPRNRRYLHSLCRTKPHPSAKIHAFIGITHTTYNDRIAPLYKKKTEDIAQSLVDNDHQDNEQDIVTNVPQTTTSFNNGTNEVSEEPSLGENASKDIEITVPKEVIDNGTEDGMTQITSEDHSGYTNDTNVSENEPQIVKIHENDLNEAEIGEQDTEECSYPDTNTTDETDLSTSDNQRVYAQEENISRIKLDDMVEEAFKDQPPSQHICVMGCRGKARHEILVNIINRLAEHKRKKKNAPHILYIWHTMRHARDFLKEYDTVFHNLGNVNVITGNNINVKPSNLMTVSNIRALLGVYNAVNTTDATDTKRLLEKLRRAITLEESIQLEDEPTTNQTNQTLTFSVGDEKLNDQNIEEFATTIKSIVNSFLQSHEEVANRDWDTNSNFPPQKEALLSQLRWSQTHYYTPEAIVQRVKLDEPGKRIVIIDNFEVNNKTRASSTLRDFIATTMRNECQMVALSYNAWNPQNVAQWFRRAIGPMDFILASKWPEIKVFYENWDYDPFENSSEPIYGKGDIDAMEKALQSNTGGLQNIFGKPIADVRPINYPFNPKFKSMIKDILKNSMALNGIDTLRKLKHYSKDAYDYVKQYLKETKKGKPNNSTGNEQTDTQDENEENDNSLTIDTILDRIINLERHAIGLKLMVKLKLNRALTSINEQYVASVVNKVIADALYPTVINVHTRKDYRAYEAALKEKFEIVPELLEEMKRRGITPYSGNQLSRGVALISRYTPKHIRNFVHDCMDKFKVIVTNHSRPEARHYVFHYAPEHWRRYKPRLILHSEASISNTCLGAEKVSLFGLTHATVARILTSLMAPMDIDFRWLNPTEALNKWYSELPEAIKSNEKLKASMQRGTFASFMKERRDAFTSLNPDMLSTSVQNYYGEEPMTYDVPYYSVTVRSDASPYLPMEELNNIPSYSATYAYETQFPYGMRTRRVTTGGLTRPMSRMWPPHQHMPKQIASGDVDVQRRTPVIRNMLDRQICLEALESRLSKAGVNMQPFYHVDQKQRRAMRYYGYLRSHIRGMLLHKAKDIQAINHAINLHGAEVIGMDDGRYKVIWMGQPSKLYITTHTIPDQVYRAMHQLFSNGEMHEFYTLLKAEKGYLFTPAMFIKDISTLPTLGVKIMGELRQAYLQKVVINKDEGVPEGSIADSLYYLALTDNTSDELPSLPESINTSEFLPERTMALVNTFLDMRRKYDAVQAQLTNDAVEKIIATPSVGVTTREEAIELLNTTRNVYRNRALGGLEIIKDMLLFRKGDVDFYGQNLCTILLYSILTLGTLIGTFVGYELQDFSVTMIILGITTISAVLICAPAWQIYCRRPIKWKYSKYTD
ncbi:uncharacterized protein BXIN_0015 [Babesia sp. Xinjiang]|uniref:uncharacterized protein n=1 Tax=Babesia sp. Xinjiang TaxID=462227 RepID=UPI000A25EDBC|nr:uncharacterized protein BXIN_0015 [Babesia sp. Xinjiang]ORM39814.1 hypothetical protein BXIN_0015 [Babesia sp. Xinjiang]